MTNPVEDAVKLANERIDAWLAELRNPERKQATGYLKRVDGSQCCLGVLCDIAGMTSVKKTYNDTVEVYLGPVTGRPEYRSNPPKCVANSVGLDTSGQIKHPDGRGVLDVPEKDWGDQYDEYRNLISLNDTSRYSFLQIADVIEKNKERMIETVRYHTERKQQA